MENLDWVKEASRLFSQQHEDVNRVYQILETQMIGLGVSPDFRHLAKEGKGRYIIPLIRYHDRVPIGYYIEIIKVGTLYKSHLLADIIATGG